MNDVFATSRRFSHSMVLMPSDLAMATAFFDSSMRAVTELSNRTPAFAEHRPSASLNLSNSCLVRYSLAISSISSQSDVSILTFLSLSSCSLTALSSILALSRRSLISWRTSPVSIAVARASAYFPFASSLSASSALFAARSDAMPSLRASRIFLLAFSTALELMSFWSSALSTSVSHFIASLSASLYLFSLNASMPSATHRSALPTYTPSSDALPIRSLKLSSVFHTLDLVMLMDVSDDFFASSSAIAY